MCKTALDGGSFVSKACPATWPTSSTEELRLTGRLAANRGWHGEHASFTAWHGADLWSGGDDEAVITQRYNDITNNGAWNPDTTAEFSSAFSSAFDI